MMNMSIYEGVVTIVGVVIIGVILVILCMGLWLARTPKNVFVDKGVESFAKVPHPPASILKWGNALDVVRAGGMNPYLKSMHKKYGPLFKFKLGFIDFVVVGSPEGLKQTVQCFDRPFVPVMTTIAKVLDFHKIPDMNGTPGRDRRKILDPFFGHTANKSFLPYLLKIAKEQVVAIEKKADEKQSFKVADLSSEFVAKALSQALWGVEIDVGHKNLTLVNDIVWYEIEVKARAIRNTKPRKQRNKDIAFAKLWLLDTINKALELRRSQHQDLDRNQDLSQDERQKAKNEAGSFIDFLLTNEYALQQVQHEGISFLVAGFGAAANLITWTMFYVAHNIEIQTKLQKEVEKLSENPSSDEIVELEYLDCVVKETLRYAGISPLSLRLSDDDFVIDNYHIPKTAWIAQHLTNVMRNVAVWGPDENIYKPERFEKTAQVTLDLHQYAFVPFSIGRRMCPGFRFAYLLAKVVIAFLYKNYSFELVPGPEIVPIHTMVLKPSRDIYLTATRR